MPMAAKSTELRERGETMTVTCLADIAARLCGRDLSDASDIPTSSGQGTSSRPAWRRARRTKAAIAVKVLAIEQAVRVLEDLDIPYAQLLLGKLVIEPTPKIQGGKTVTFWPAKKRLRIGRRATQRQQDIRAFEQALADQGHRIPGYVSRPARLSRSPRLSKEERLQARQEADLAEMECAHAQLMDSLRDMTEDLIAGRRIRRRDPRSARAKRLFRRAWNRV
jgi:hypothetical protein